jgi:LPPG:FO 2-phospho-L-lactate transferase
MVLGPHIKVAALVGGVGGAKLAYGLAKVLSPEQLSIIGNVGDDFRLYGLHISPDLDTVMYTLAEVANPATGWGLAGDTWQMLDMLRAYGESPWFSLGDRDLATHLLRTQWLAQGKTLTEVMGCLLSGLGVEHRLLPVTDDPLATMVDTLEHGTLAFQDYFVRYQWQPTVTQVWYQGADRAQMTDQVAAALDAADAIIICPSNPVLSIEPLLVVPGLREKIAARRGVCIAVSPFIGGQAVKGPAAKLMGELNLDISVQGLLGYYAGLLDGLVIDATDREQVLADEPSIMITDTMMNTPDDKVRLARECLAWVGRLNT